MTEPPSRRAFLELSAGAAALALAPACARRDPSCGSASAARRATAGSSTTSTGGRTGAGRARSGVGPTAARPRCR